MKLKTLMMLVLAVFLAVAISGCAQDSTDSTNENPEMQERLLKGQDDVSVEDEGKQGGESKQGSQSTNPTRTTPKGGTSGNKLALSADPGGALKYNTDQLSANAGDLTINFVNASPVPHDVAVEQGSKKLGQSEEITKSKTTLKLDGVKAGTYSYFCTVPGHRQAGMEGTLTVR